MGRKINITKDGQKNKEWIKLHVKLRSRTFFIYDQRSYTNFLRQWREITISLGNRTFVATVQKIKNVCTYGN